MLLELPGLLVLPVTRLTANPGVPSSILIGSYTFVEIDRELISVIILLLSLIQEGLLSVTSMCTKYWLSPKVKHAQE